MIYLQLLWSFFQIGLFSFGGGYAAIPLIQGQVVDLHHWLTLTEFTDLVTISQMTPGPIAINAATFVGTRIAGPGGAVIATVGNVLPSCIIVTIMALLYFRYKKLSVIQGILGGLRPAVVAFIASAGLTILVLSFWGTAGFSFNLKAVDYIAVGLFTAGLCVLRIWKINPIYVMLGSGVIGGLLYYLV